MRKIAGILFIMFCEASVLFGQEELLDFYQPNFLPVVNPREYLDIQFKWDLPGKPQAYLNSGITELKEGSVALAVQNFSESLAMYQFWPTYYYRGIANILINQLADAENDLLKTIHLNPQCVEAYIMLGDVYQLQYRFDKAENQYEKATRLAPTMVHSFYRLGNVAFVKGENPKAARYYEKCNAIDPSFPNAYLQLGMLRFSTKRKDRDAISYFDKAIEADSSYKDGLFWRGMAYISLNDHEKALSNWSRLLQLNPNNPLLQVYRGVLLMELNQFDRAFIDLRDALMMYHEDEEQYGKTETLLDKKIDLQAAVTYLARYGYGLEEESFALLKKGFCFLMIGKKPEAISCFRNANKIEPSSSSFYLTAIGYEHILRHDSAHYFYNLALKHDNDLLDAYKRRAIYRYEIKDWKGSYSDFSEMIRLQPESLVPYRLRGYVKAHLKDYYGCIIDLAHVLKYDSLDAEVWTTRGFCRQQVGDTLGSLRDSKRSLLIKPTNISLLKAVAEGLLKEGDTSNAIETFLLYQQTYPKDPYPNSQLAMVYIGMEEFGEANVAIGRNFEIIKSNAFVSVEDRITTLLLDGIVAYYQGKNSWAMARFNEILKMNPNHQEARNFRYKLYLRTGDTKKAAADLKLLQKAGIAGSEVNN